MGLQPRSLQCWPHELRGEWAERRCLGVPSLASPLCQLPVPPCLTPPFSRTRGRMVRTPGFPGMTGTIGARDPPWPSPPGPQGGGPSLVSFQEATSPTGPDPRDCTADGVRVTTLGSPGGPTSPAWPGAPRCPGSSPLMCCPSFSERKKEKKEGGREAPFSWAAVRGPQGRAEPGPRGRPSGVAPPPHSLSPLPLPPLLTTWRYHPGPCSQPRPGLRVGLAVTVGVRRGGKIAEDAGMRGRL